MADDADQPDDRDGIDQAMAAADALQACLPLGMRADKGDRLIAADDSR